MSKSIAGNKICSNAKCKLRALWQPISNFNKDRSNKVDGLDPRCKQCRHDQTKELRLKNGPKILTQQQKEIISFRHKVYSKTEAGKISHRQSSWKSQGIINPDGNPFLWHDFLVIFSSQGNKCAICSHSLPGHQDWAVDHDHNTGIARGILCNDCNWALGRFQDSYEIIASAALYLKRFQV